MTAMIRAVDRWLPGYLGSTLRRAGRARHGGAASLRHLMFGVADHFEPFRSGVDARAAVDEVARWVQAYPPAVAGFRDADGRPPCHTFFYPQEQYDRACLDALTELTRAGFAEVDVHLHHRHDTPEGLREKLTSFVELLGQKHGLLGIDRSGCRRYGFVHGNWALCNSRPDGDWCGVDDELAVLKATGCYADFTFPSAPSPTQPRLVNAIYYAWDTPGVPRAHDTGVFVTTPGRRGRRVEPGPDSGGRPAKPEGLMLIQGPLGLDWKRRKWGVLPRLDNAAISGTNPPSPDRVDLWRRQGIGVLGMPAWVFVKVHAHGCTPGASRVLLGDPMRACHEYLQTTYNDGTRWALHYVSAREMYNIIRAAEVGETGNPGAYRDFEIAPPPVCAADAGVKS